MCVCVCGWNPFQILKLFPQIRSTIPGIARWSLEWFQIRWPITFNLCVIGGIREYRCVRLIENFVPVLSIRRFAANRQFSSRLQRTPSSLLSFPQLLSIEFLRSSHVRSPSLSLLPQHAPSPSFPPPRACAPLGRWLDPFPPALVSPLPLPRWEEIGGRKEMVFLRKSPWF
jgi:hypothetical protein